MPLHYFGTLDYVFMGLHVLMLIGLGIYLKGRASESLEDDIIGGRKVPWWAMDHPVRATSPPTRKRNSKQR